MTSIWNCNTALVSRCPGCLWTSLHVGCYTAIITLMIIAWCRRIHPSQFQAMMHGLNAAVEQTVPRQHSVIQYTQESDAERLARWEYVRLLGLLEPERNWFVSGKRIWVDELQKQAGDREFSKVGIFKLSHLCSRFLTGTNKALLWVEKSRPSIPCVSEDSMQQWWFEMMSISYQTFSHIEAYKYHCSDSCDPLRFLWPKLHRFWCLDLIHICVNRCITHRCILTREQTLSTCHWVLRDSSVPDIKFLIKLMILNSVEPELEALHLKLQLRPSLHLSSGCRSNIAFGLGSVSISQNLKLTLNGLSNLHVEDWH